MFLNLTYVAFGGALGAVLRYLCGQGIARMASGALPLGVLSVNVVGSFLMGLFVVWASRRSMMDLSPFVMVGLLGGFTTFSAFSLETVTLLERGAFGTALIYVILSVIGSVLALALGVWIAKGMLP